MLVLHAKTGNVNSPSEEERARAFPSCSRNESFPRSRREKERERHDDAYNPDSPGRGIHGNSFKSGTSSPRKIALKYSSAIYMFARPVLARILPSSLFLLPLFSPGRAFLWHFRFRSSSMRARVSLSLSRGQIQYFSRSAFTLSSTLFGCLQMAERHRRI